MQADPTTTTPGRRADAPNRVRREIENLGLTRNIADLDSDGYTVLKSVLSTSQIERAREAILQRVANDTGKQINVDTATADDFEGMTYLPYLLYDNEVFEEILLLPEPLALITYLLGESCLLSSLGCHFKGPGESGVLPLHSDNGNGMPPPYPAYSQVANINYALTEYSEAAGALALVPGSHRWARPPTVAEMGLAGEHRNAHAISMDISPGDAVIWHGNTWHGSFARQTPGIRMNLAVYFARQYLQTQELHKGVVPEDALARHADNPRFGILLGGKQPYGWRHAGPDYTVMARNPTNQFD